MTQAYSDSKEKIAKSAGRISGATIVSRILGLGRDSLFAALFGTSYMGDAFNIAFLIPNFFRRVFGEGALNASYVPVYTHYLHQYGESEAVRFARKIFSVLVLILGVLVALGIIYAAPIVRTYAFGWRDNPEIYKLTIKLTRILFPYIFFVSLAALGAGTLNSRGYFGIPALAPAMLNVALITTSVALLKIYDHLNETMVVIFSIGALIGGLLQIAIQIPHLVKTGHGIGFDPDFRDPGVRWVGKLMLPGLLTFAVTQVNTFVDTLLATTLPEGSVTALRLGNRIAVQPLGIFGAAITTAVLPTLSRHAAKKDTDKLLSDFVFSTRLILALILPSMVLLLLLARPIVRLLFERGAFTASRSTPMTSSALIFYAFGLFAYGGSRSVIQAFYSMKDTLTPMKVAVVTVCTNVALDLILIRPLGLRGLALATSISGAVGLSLLVSWLRVKLGRVDGRQIWETVSKVMLASATMGIVIVLVSRLTEPFAVNLWGKLFQVLSCSLLALLTYLGLALALRIKEIIFLVEIALKRVLKR